MKPVLAKTLFAAVLLTNLSTFAQGLNAQLSTANGLLSKGGVATGGGDLCEDRIQSIRDDLKKWIVEGGSQSLKLPAGFTAQKYKDEMLEKIQTTSVRCVGNGDAGYPVTVEGSAKVCRFDRNSSLNLITCDYKKFQAMSESDQYVLVHHEYAGLADVERPNGSDSDYRVSNQISGSLVDQVVKKLAVKTADGAKTIPADRVDDYKTAMIQAAKNLRLYHCNVVGEKVSFADWAMAKSIGRATSLKIKTNGSKSIYAFELERLYTDGDQHRVVTTIKSDNSALQSIRMEQFELKDFNAGTLDNPHIVKKFISTSWGECALKND